MFKRSLLGLFLWVGVIVGYADTPTVVGYWMQRTDAGQPQSVIHITKTPTQYIGRVITGFPVQGEVVPPEYCDECEGALKHHFIQGMIIMTDLQDAGNGEYNHGHILDPTSGSIYHVKLRLLNDGQSLYVRGYIGIPWFGRSQTWQRIPEDQVAKVVGKGYRFKGKPVPHL